MYVAVLPLFRKNRTESSFSSGIRSFYAQSDKFVVRCTMASGLRRGGCLGARNWMRASFRFSRSDVSGVLGSKNGNIQRIGGADCTSVVRPFSSSQQMHVRLVNKRISNYRHEKRLMVAELVKHPARMANADILVAGNQFHGRGIIDGLEQKWHRHGYLDEKSGTFGFNESRISFWNRMSVEKRVELVQSLKIVLGALGSSRHPIFRNLPFVDELGRNYLDKLGASVHAIQRVFDLGWNTDEIFPSVMISPQLFLSDMKLFAILCALCESYPVYWSQEVWYL